MSQVSSPVEPSRKTTRASTFSDDAVPETDPSNTAGLLAERLQAWKHAVVYLEEYMEAVEKSHKVQAKEYEKVLKTISKPLREGQHFDQSLGGIAGFFENMRANTQAHINTNSETEKNIKGSVLPVLERLHQEIKNKSKELAHGAQKGAKEVEKARNTTQKHIELLGQNTASFESTGGKMAPHDDPYVIRRGVVYRLHHQVLEENNHRNDLLAVQNNFQAFEAHIIQVVQQAMESFNQYVGGQAEKSRALYSDMLAAAQRIPADFEWKGFAARNKETLMDPNEEPRSVEHVHFPNMDHSSTKPLIEGTLERKSRNKLSWGYQTGYYVVTPSKFLHEFKDSDNMRKDPTPELSIYLPDATAGTPSGDKFHVKGKDRSKTMSSKLTGSSELSFKAHSSAEATKWFDVIRSIAGNTGRIDSMSPSVTSAASAASADEGKKSEGSASHPTVVTDDKGQESGVITGEETVASPTAASPTSPADGAATQKAAGSNGEASASVPSSDSAATTGTEKVAAAEKVAS